VKRDYFGYLLLALGTLCVLVAVLNMLTWVQIGSGAVIQMVVGAVVLFLASQRFAKGKRQDMEDI